MKGNIAFPVFFMPGLLCFFLAVEVHYVVGLMVTGQRHHVDDKRVVKHFSNWTIAEMLLEISMQGFRALN